MLDSIDQSQGAKQKALDALDRGHFVFWKWGSREFGGSDGLRLAQQSAAREGFAQVALCGKDAGLDGGDADIECGGGFFLRGAFDETEMHCLSASGAEAIDLRLQQFVDLVLFELLLGREA